MNSEVMRQKKSKEANSLLTFFALSADEGTFYK